MASIRDCLLRICGEWESARAQPFSNHPLASFIRRDFRDSIESALGEFYPDFLIKGSAGAGNWASVPWLSILDPTITTSTTEGYYVVYLFKADGSGVYLSINQGTTGPKEQLGAIAAEKQAQRIIKSLRAEISGLDSWLKDIHLAASTALGASYEPSNIAARYYPATAIPSESVLEGDLKDAMRFAIQARTLWKKAINMSADPNEGSREPNSRQHAHLPKPFLILAGISGTGKTRWVRKTAERTSKGKSNLCLIPVRPDWHEPSDLLGYTSRISSAPKFVATSFLSFLVEAWKNAWATEKTLATSANAVVLLTPHWVCLDEMNLAPVEQYFADYLSVVESRSWDGGAYACDPLFSFESRQEDELDAIRFALLGANPDADAKELWDRFCSAPKPGIPPPPNLVVVGTVNMDETTHAFSRKVLDRAFTVEFDPDDIVNSYRGNNSVDPIFGVELADGQTLPTSAILSTLTSGKDVPDPVRKEVDALIETWNAVMDETPFRVAYRTLNEALLYAASKHAAEANEERKGLAIKRALDDLLMMKLLPRLEGDADKLSCDEVALPKEDSFPTEARNSLLAKLWGRLPPILGEAWNATEPPCKSKKKLRYMAKRLARTGYTSFWP